MKQNLTFFIVVVGLALTFIICLVVFFRASKNVPVSTVGYYDNLEVICENREAECCLTSVKIMKSGNYKLAVNRTCPEGHVVNMLKCLGTFQWCEPELN